MMPASVFDERFHRDVADLLDLPELHASRERAHHFDLSEYEHLLQVAQTAHRVSRFLRADPRICARAGLLHDLGAHWFDTAAPCTLAARLEEPPSVRHAIRAHTLFPILPRTREAWVVVAADLITSARECHFVFRRTRDRAKERVHRQLQGRTLRLGGRLALTSRLPAGTRLSRPRLPRPRLQRLRRLRLSPFPGLKPGPYVLSPDAIPALSAVTLASPPAPPRHSDPYTS